MDHFLPDWMFAAFAIGGWELFHFLSRRTGISQLTWVSWGIVVICAAVLAVRYSIRLLRRWRRTSAPADEDDWRNY